MLLNLVMTLAAFNKEYEQAKCIGIIIAVLVAIITDFVDKTEMHPRSRRVTWFLRISRTCLFIFIPIVLALVMGEEIANRNPKNSRDVICMVIIPD